MNYYLAIDIGASSGRHILGHVENGKILLEEVFRFDNKQVRRNGHDCWDMENLWSGILGGLKACKKAGKIPETIGIDTWAVDFVLLDADGNLIGDAVGRGQNRGKRDFSRRTVRPDRHSKTDVQYHLPTDGVTA